MYTVIRVKRRLDEEPFESFIINCKRSKLDLEHDPNENPLTTVFQLGTTIDKQEDTLKYIKPTKPSIDGENFKKHIVNLSDKIKNDVATKSKNNRYQVVNYFRSKGTQECEASNTNEDVTIVDVEEKPADESVKQDDDQSSSYVYDLYYTNSDDFGEVNLDDLITVYPLSNTLMYGSARDNGKIDSDEDTDDSNAENNWRNDYPDESDMESITEDDIIDAVKRVTLEDDLSSDDGEEGFVYSIDSEAAGFEEDVDPSDVRRYGEMYARFKARHRKNDHENNTDNSDFYCGDIDENEYYY